MRITQGWSVENSSLSSFVGKMNGDMSPVHILCTYICKMYGIQQDPGHDCKDGLASTAGRNIYTELGLENRHNHDRHQGRQFPLVRRYVVRKRAHSSFWVTLVPT